MEITYGCNTAPIRKSALRASFCLTALLRGLKVEKLNCNPSADMIQLSGPIEQIQDVCRREYKGAVTFVESDGVDQNGHKWWNVHENGARVTGIVRRGEVWALHV